MSIFTPEQHNGIAHTTPHDFHLLYIKKQLNFFGEFSIILLGKNLGGFSSFECENEYQVSTNSLLFL